MRVAEDTRSIPQLVRTVVLASPAPERSATNALRIAGDRSCGGDADLDQ